MLELLPYYINLLVSNHLTGLYCIIFTVKIVLQRFCWGLWGIEDSWIDSHIPLSLVCLTVTSVQNTPQNSQSFRFHLKARVVFTPRVFLRVLWVLKGFGRTATKLLSYRRAFYKPLMWDWIRALSHCTRVCVCFSWLVRKWVFKLQRALQYSVRLIYSVFPVFWIICVRNRSKCLPYILKIFPFAARKW